MAENTIPDGLLDAFTSYVQGNPHSTPGNEDEFIEQCLREAMVLVDHRCGASKGNVPMEALHRAYIEAGSELYNRKQAPSGISQFASADGTPIRVARDPMVAAEPILRPFLPLGIA